MRLIWIIVMSLDYCSSHTADPILPPRSPRPLRKWIQSSSVRWVGVLAYRKTTSAPESLAGIILIKSNLGMANAFDVSHIPKSDIRNTTSAMFLLREGVVRTARVTDYVLHPEFDQHTLNTIALLKLEYNPAHFKWLLPKWPNPEEKLNHQLGKVYAIGYIDEHQALEQVMHAMDYYDLNKCNTFLRLEKLDKRWLTPTAYQCFRETSSSQQCVFESGMALASHHAGNWKLLGISILGPGCALPARFIDFTHYVPWVRKYFAARTNVRRPKLKPIDRMFDTVIVNGANVQFQSKRILRTV